MSNLIKKILKELKENKSFIEVIPKEEKDKQAAKNLTNILNFMIRNEMDNDEMDNDTILTQGIKL